MTRTSSLEGLLATKLHPPPLQTTFIPRPRLLSRFLEGQHKKLTLISAPAGFGKTTLVSEWLHQTQLPTAWLSLDENDNDLTRFLSYIIAALQKSAPGFAEDILQQLRSPQHPTTDILLTDLLNAISELSQQHALVLDDYHTLDHPDIDRTVAFLLDYLPQQLRLVIATREDPQFPLSRLRVQGQLTELRVADLRFQPKEAANFLQEITGLQLSEEEISALDARTEGWIAGLQLAALSMQGRDDINGFIRAFAGNNRYIVDYLLEEVLQRQPEEIRHFLMQTSILDRLCPPLCSAVSEQPQSTKLLEALERGNLFLIPLDDRRYWFRYHHLFADVLQAHALKEQPKQIPQWHQRASQWYAEQGMHEQAIRHAFAAKDFELAAVLLEKAWPDMDGEFQSNPWQDLAEKLPLRFFRRRPVLTTNYAWALLNRGEMEKG
ncbi:MAG: AAA family ATPase, partial [Myxococcales bacterium]|nr:AAA family ATPase [Myxococcales bacterium]